MAHVFFFVAAIGAIAGAIGVVTLRSAFYSVLALVGHLISLAMLFLLLRAEFVAAAQVVVYAGAVMVLYIFVVAYIGGTDQPIGPEASRSMKLGSLVFAGALFVELAIAVLGTGLKAVNGKGAGYAPGPNTFGTPGYIGNLLLTKFLLPFEVASFLLLIAAVGAVTLARRRRGLGDAEVSTLTPMDFLRPAWTGTMAEAVEGRHGAEGVPAELESGSPETEEVGAE